MSNPTLAVSSLYLLYDQYIFLCYKIAFQMDPKGIINLGDTCYLSSVWQALLSVKDWLDCSTVARSALPREQKVLKYYYFNTIIIWIGKVLTTMQIRGSSNVFNMKSAIWSTMRGAGLEWSGVETHNMDDLNILISKEFSEFRSAKTRIWNWQVFS